MVIVTCSLITLLTSQNSPSVKLDISSSFVVSIVFISISLLGGVNPESNRVRGNVCNSTIIL